MSRQPSSDDNAISVQIESTPTVTHSPSQHSTTTTTTTTTTTRTTTKTSNPKPTVRITEPKEQQIKKSTTASGFPNEKSQSPTGNTNVGGDKEEIIEDSKENEELGEPLEAENGDPEKSEAPQHDTWTDWAHMHRPDRHLFPYRSVRENWHAARTFLRRFFFLFLIIPAWVVPNVLEAKLPHGAAGGEGNTTEVSHVALQSAGLKFVMLAESGEAEHGADLRPGQLWAVFLLNLLVMVHLSKAAGAALEELVPRFGSRVIGVVDAMTSSSVELAVASFALKEGLVVVVQAAMLGAILNNLLMMLGIAMVIGGLKNHQQKLKKETTRTSVNILMLTCIAYIIPLALDGTLESLYQNLEPATTDQLTLQLQQKDVREKVDKDILTLSKCMSIILLLIYVACLAYQYHHRTFMITPESKHEGKHTVERRYTHFWFAAFAYIVTMAAEIYSAKLLVHAVEGLGRAHHLNDSFVGFVLLPIVLIADLQEEVVSFKESYEDRLDKAVALMVGSCMQIALLVTPILVILGWILKVPMTLKFSLLEVIILVTSVLLINYLLADHESNWLEGTILLAVFLMCAIAFYYDDSHKDVGPDGGTTLSGETDPLLVH
ncbi:hypothetical protein BGX26_011737 [Mortierella sp. AD094]|nr:hypothetical protein BGX26_011737 [Mortierella sp. AD094]